MGAFVYMLKCADGSYYVGCATGDDLTKRIAEHQTGFYPGYTPTRRPVRLVWSEYFEQITDAIAVERQLKGWSRAKKEALISGNWDAVRLLSKRRAGRPHSTRPINKPPPKAGL
jgi:putative endonuclease